MLVTKPGKARIIFLGLGILLRFSLRGFFGGCDDWLRVSREIVFLLFPYVGFVNLYKFVAGDFSTLCRVTESDALWAVLMHVSWLNGLANFWQRQCSHHPSSHVKASVLETI